MLGITVDNATNNDKMVETLAELNASFPGPVNQIRCFAHIINLIAKSLLKLFGSRVHGQADGGDKSGNDAVAALLAAIKAGENLESIYNL